MRCVNLVFINPCLCAKHSDLKPILIFVLKMGTGLVNKYCENEKCISVVEIETIKLNQPDGAEGSFFDHVSAVKSN